MCIKCPKTDFHRATFFKHGGISVKPLRWHWPPSTTGNHGRNGRSEPLFFWYPRSSKWHENHEMTMPLTSPKCFRSWKLGLRQVRIRKRDILMFIVKHSSKHMYGLSNLQSPMLAMLTCVFLNNLLLRHHPAQTHVEVMSTVTIRCMLGTAPMAGLESRRFMTHGLLRSHPNKGSCEKSVLRCSAVLQSQQGWRFFWHLLTSFDLLKATPKKQIYKILQDLFFMSHSSLLRHPGIFKRSSQLEAYLPDLSAFFNRFNISAEFYATQWWTPELLTSWTESLGQCRCPGFWPSLPTLCLSHSSCGWVIWRSCWRMLACFFVCLFCFVSCIKVLQLVKMNVSCESERT